MQSSTIKQEQKNGTGIRTPIMDNWTTNIIEYRVLNLNQNIVLSEMLSVTYILAITLCVYTFSLSF